MYRGSEIENMFYFKQMMCVELNLVEIVSTIMRIVCDQDRFATSILLTLKLIISITEDNMTA